ncbi:MULTISPECIES: 3-hydroxyacyl-ACP dehydratase FabZ family protein [unclassified Brenneria]|uniref:3-hydroxyacyl-ACP dehydratase FabZ family protein n=1 Tax=unclassified Brenneria TaxID=2634434 RepID=UPI00155204D4|nr:MULTISPECIES: hydroxymyristoyl-ACP dehydratase [unclassified Brenneria]MBJ7222265.1 hydroxymyristoyl-ACP dehydratase [Brenneria sp. L3-3C-1]MEE3643508.1 hydroxymyristoyl-ACP dehydratase [Brenneria sp. L3_3C_1]MEE3651692.1 hydroxymyristoyl-ACP dehydratase [Brenneria sp. HEZEL_4_2_4]NPD01648.1 hydroxymyristoyl-ACP dehydratase [Brenneria sp. hezel4-2-4]
MLPVELSRQCAEQRAELTLRATEDLFWFKGHFPGQPLLPGVAQLDWALRYAAELLAPGWRFSSVENIKFQQPILPGKILRLVLVWHADKQWLTFSYHILDDEAERIASSGKIKLCR